MKTFNSHQFLYLNGLMCVMWETVAWMLVIMQVESWWLKSQLLLVQTIVFQVMTLSLRLQFDCSI